MKNIYFAKDMWCIKGKTPDFITEELDKLYDIAKHNSYLLPSAKKALAGYIKDEYFVKHSKEFNDFIINTITDNLEFINDSSQVFKHSDYIQIETQWINIQKSGESNPVHDHSGAYSYVFWHKIPFTFEDEIKVSPIANTSTTSFPGDFYFHFVDFDEPFFKEDNNYGYLRTIAQNVDNFKEGTFCIFPAYLSHSVQPFYSSDKDRVTFSGNLSNSEYNKKTKKTLV